MKKFLTWLAVAVMACVISVGAFANGPLLGVAFVPTTAAFTMLTFGWDFGAMNIEFQKDNMTFLTGPLNTAVLWTPSGLDGFGYRLGAKLLTTYVAAAAPTGRLRYDAFAFTLGASKAWGPIQLYGDLNLAPRGAGILRITPIVGVNFLFGDLVANEAVE